MEQQSKDRRKAVDAQVARLGVRMLERADELAAALVARIQAAVPAYRTDAVVATDELLATCRANIDFVFGPSRCPCALGRPTNHRRYIRLLSALATGCRHFQGRRPTVARPRASSASNSNPSRMARFDSQSHSRNTITPATVP
jgi:hypothetical protein